MNQIVYILTNESMPEFVKIGFTHGKVGERIKQLDRTGVPLPFEIYYAANVEDAKKEEKWLHSIFADRRARDNREFFKMNPEYAALALKRVEIDEVIIDSGLTPEQEKEVDEVRERRSRFHFANFGIPIGSKLTFTRDSSIIAEVVENNKIIIDGKTGLLVEKGNYKEIIEKISILINDEKKREQIGNAEYEFVKNNFTWKETVKGFISVINEKYDKINLIQKDKN